jgi:hypothetical protein
MHIISRTSVAALAVVLAGCSNQTERPVTTKSAQGSTTSAAGDVAEDRGTSLVRVVHALGTHSAVTIRVDDSTAAFENVSFKTVTPYREQRGNTVKFVLFDAARVPAAGATPNDADSAHMVGDSGDANDGLATNNEMMQDGERYTVFVMPSDDGTGARMRVVRDAPDTDDGKARIRFVNAVPLGGELDLRATNQEDAIFDDVNYGNEAGYKDIDPRANVTLTVRGDKTSATSVRDLKRIDAGKSYTVVAAGRAGKVTVIHFEDEVAGAANAANNDDKAKNK